MSLSPHTLPAGDSTTARFARELSILLGPAHGHAPTGSNTLDDLTVLGYGLAYAWQRQRDSVAEAHPATASELLAELEAEYGLPVDLSIDVDTRRATLLAKLRARFEATPDAITATAAPVALITLVENAQLAVDHTWPAAVWVFAVAMGSAWASETKRARVNALVQQQKQAHTVAVLTPDADGFLCDDEGSLTDRDVLDT